MAVSGIATLGNQPVRAAGDPITFSTPTVMSPTESVGEPTIAISPAADSTVYASGPWGSGTQRSIWFASADGGRSFRVVNQCNPQSGEVAAECQPPSAVAGSPNPPGGGDTDQRVDSSGQDYFADLWALSCDRVATTTDFGAHANQNALGCNRTNTSGSTHVSQSASDRQWLSIYDPKLTGAVTSAPDAALGKVIYMEFNGVASVDQGPGGCFWVKSTDGVTYSDADHFLGHYGCDGYPSVDQVTGDVFQPAGGQLQIGVPDAQGNLTFLDDAGGNAIGHQLINFAGGVGATDILFAVSSMDSGRNLHITWTAGGDPNTGAGGQIYTTVASAKTNWTHFATPVQVSTAPSITNVFPWVASGAAGRSDSVWYGTSDGGDPSANNGQQWYPFMAQTVWPVDADGAVTLAAPTTTMVRVSPHPTHYNSICLAGTNCIESKGDRNLADFFSVAIDHSGAALVEYDDTTNGLEEAGFTPSNGLADHAGAPLVTIARQDGGPGVLGSDVTLRPGEVGAAPTDGISDPGGDALYPVIGGTAVNALDLTGTHLSLSADGSTLTVSMDVADLSAAGVTSAFSSVPGSAFLQYVTRWEMCPPDSSTETNNCTIYYAEAETTPAGQGNSAAVQYFAGKAQSIDLCSVSACDPHAIYFPESPSSQVPTATGNPETGSLTCPDTPSAATPCTLTINVATADIGGANAQSLLEEVGSYSFAAARPQAAITFPQAEADQLPLEVDGVCCFNFQGSAPGTTLPEAPWSPLLPGAAVAALAGSALWRRRRHDSSARNGSVSTSAR